MHVQKTKTCRKGVTNMIIQPGCRYICDGIIVNAVNISNFLICIFFGGLEFAGHSFAYCMSPILYFDSLDWPAI